MARQCSNSSLATPAEYWTDLEDRVRAETSAVRVSNLARVVVFIVKAFVSARTGSLAIIASTLDSFLGSLFGLILWIPPFFVKRPNTHLYPIGKQQMLPAEILAFASIMAALGLNVMIVSANRLISKDKRLATEGCEGDMVIGISMSATMAQCFVLLYCQEFTSNLVRAIHAREHAIDVMISLMGLFAAILASKLCWWIDPVVGIALAWYTMISWLWAALESVRSLVGGESAPAEVLQKMASVSRNFDGRVQVESVRAHSYGQQRCCMGEVGIVLPDDMPLRVARDVGDGLQMELMEALPHHLHRVLVHLRSSPSSSVITC